MLTRLYIVSLDSSCLKFIRLVFYRAPFTQSQAAFSVSFVDLLAYYRFSHDLALKIVLQPVALHLSGASRFLPPLPAPTQIP